MDVGSPENGFDELNDLLKDDDSSLAGEIGLSFIVNNEENASNYGFENLSSSNDFCVDVNEEVHQVQPSLPCDYPYYDFPGFPEKFQSPLQAGFVNVVSEIKDVERLPSPPKAYYQQDKTEEICGSYLSTSLLRVESETLRDDIKAEVSEPRLGPPPRQDATQEAEMEDRPASPADEEMVQGTFLDISAYESTISEFANKEGDKVLDPPADISSISPRLNADISETKSEHNQQWITSHPGSRKCDMSFSPRKSPGVSKSPNMRPSCLKACSSQQNLVTHKQRHRSSPEISDLGKRIDPSPHSGRKTSASPRRSGQAARQINDSSLKCSSISPRNHYSNQNHRRQGRSLSKSPVKQKESSSRHKRKNHDRSRSRSPYKRDHHRRSPRHRYSPRRKSPPSDNHSNRRSPRRRVWSPPHNRSTGLGKPGRNLFVAGFSFLTTERDLERKFSRFGCV